ncbi:uncharacterized protein [Fopius arisanus]|uniref:Uncharacterized protein isoform X3 n=1 Tax=Fopius arisanus TaxID=64838 RepID=A0A9R1U8M4_9HYME|nr:PREDICTED: uncharacterized protein LOC105271524 isoform X3 [Fopius arisanus]
MIHYHIDNLQESFVRQIFHELEEGSTSSCCPRISVNILQELDVMKGTVVIIQSDVESNIFSNIHCYQLVMNARNSFVGQSVDDGVGDRCDSFVDILPSRGVRSRNSCGP